jgi:hypothetical protein
MKFSPRRTWLYRNQLSAVTLIPSMIASFLLAGALVAQLAAQGPITQYGRKPKADKGPRALGLIQLSPKGNKGRIIPIAIMMDGKFYDAGSYKATPVPIALDFDIVYEGFRTGVSQGIFTITQPGQLNHAWIAEGTWLPAGAKAPEKSKKYSEPVIEDKDAPPVLHRHSEKAASEGGTGGKDKDKDKDQQKPSAPPSAKPPAPETAKTPVPPETAKTSASNERIEDPNRPRLRRGKPNSNARREPFTTFDALTETAPGTSSTSAGKADAKAARSPEALPPIVTVPAISDAGGPDPRPYTYDVKPAEEAIYRNKMLALAAVRLRAEAGPAEKEKEAAPTHRKSSSRKSAGKSSALSAPDFDEVSLRIFDLSNSNEPVLVLSAKTRPPAAGATGSIEEPKEITLIARTNLEGEVQKLFFAQTDSQHLDVAPRLELIDAVDADGDGRGELLFRRTFDGGSAYAIYRVTADGLWPLFEGTP